MSDIRKLLATLESVTKEATSLNDLDNLRVFLCSPMAGEYHVALSPKAARMIIAQLKNSEKANDNS